MAFFSKSTLSAEQNSVRLWAVLLILVNIASTGLGFHMELYVSAVAAAAAIVIGIALLLLGPKDKESGGLTYKITAIVSLALVIANGVGLYLLYEYGEDQKALGARGRAVCCPEALFAQSVCPMFPGQPSCELVERLTKEKDIKIASHYGTICASIIGAIILLVKVILAFKSLKTRASVDDTVASKTEV